MNPSIHRTPRALARTALFALALAGSAAAPLAAYADPGHNDSNVCHSCGTVISSHTYEEGGKGTGLGIAGGAVIGGLLGNHVGNGNGRTLATVAGAVGGGYAGNSVEKRARSSTVTDVRVRMNDGSEHTYKENNGGRFRNGSHVQVVHGSLQAR